MNSVPQQDQTHVSANTATMQPIIVEIKSLVDGVQMAVLALQINAIAILLIDITETDAKTAYTILRLLHAEDQRVDFRMMGADV